MRNTVMASKLAHVPIDAGRRRPPVGAILKRAPVLFAALIALVGAAFCLAAGAAEPETTVVKVTGGDAPTRPLTLGIGKSLVVELPQDAKDVLVADTTVANALVRSARRAYLIGLKVGQTNVFFFDADGRQIVGFDIAVTRDLNGIRAAVKKVLPQSEIHVEGLNDSVVLSGSVANASESQQVFDMASRLAGADLKVVNGLTIRGRDQVMLRVTVAEMQRDIVKQLGIDLNGSFNVGTSVVNFNTLNPFGGTGAPLPFPTPQDGINAFGVPNALTGLPRIGATIRAMERAGVIRTLAEPNLTAISGEAANFLAGGEFPVLAGRSCDQGICTQTIVYKKFGVSLSFTPVVLTEGRISLKVTTEVSELSTEGALSVADATFTAVKTRRADTTVEIPSGGSLAMAGMIQEQTKQQLNGMPGLMQLPVLGTLFKSREYLNRQTELVVLVTPYIVRAVAQKDLSRPDDGFADATDPAAVLLGRFNRIYGVAGREKPRRAYHGNYGFILD
jgi:pilus assembly protein CpaC